MNTNKKEISVKFEFAKRAFIFFIAIFSTLIPFAQSLNLTEFEKLLNSNEREIKTYILLKGFSFLKKSNDGDVYDIYIKKNKSDIKKSEFVYFGIIRYSKKIRVIYATDNELYNTNLFNAAQKNYDKYTIELMEGNYWFTKPNKLILRINPTEIDSKETGLIYPWQFEFSQFNN